MADYFESNDRFPEISEETGEVVDDGCLPIPKTGEPDFDSLSEPEKIRGLKQVEDEPMAGVIRQVLARPTDPLTDKQAHTYLQAAKAAIEKCSTCKAWIPLNDVHCPTCRIEYGGS